jgi:hypothetical protein
MEFIWFSEQLVFIDRVNLVLWGTEFFWCSFYSQNTQNLFVELIFFWEEKEIICGVNSVLRTNIVLRVLVTKGGVRTGNWIY